MDEMVTRDVDVELQHSLGGHTWLNDAWIETWNCRVRDGDM